MTTPIPATSLLSAISFLGGFAGASIAQPNPRRTILAKTANWREDFPGMTTNDVDALTFDLSRLLDVGETIQSIVSFALSVLGPDGVTDLNVASRTAGVAEINQASISQRFGNWQSLPWIKYLVTAEVITSAGSTIEVSAYLSVRAPTN